MASVLTPHLPSAAILSVIRPHTLTRSIRRLRGLPDPVDIPGRGEISWHGGQSQKPCKRSSLFHLVHGKGPGSHRSISWMGETASSLCRSSILFKIFSCIRRVKGTGPRPLDVGVRDRSGSPLDAAGSDRHAPPDGSGVRAGWHPKAVEAGRRYAIRRRRAGEGLPIREDFVRTRRSW